MITSPSNVVETMLSKVSKDSLFPANIQSRNLFVSDEYVSLVKWTPNIWDFPKLKMFVKNNKIIWICKLLYKRPRCYHTNDNKTRWQTGSLNNWPKFMLQRFVRFPEFAEFTEFLLNSGKTKLLNLSVFGLDTQVISGTALVPWQIQYYLLLASDNNWKRMKLSLL